MTKKQMTRHDEDVLLAVLIYFTAVGKFSITAEEFVEAEKARMDYCYFDLDDVKAHLQKALAIGFVSKTDSFFTLNLDDELIAEVIADQIKNKEIFIANVDSRIRFLERYRQERSKPQPAI